MIKRAGKCNCGSSVSGSCGVVNLLRHGPHGSRSADAKALATQMVAKGRSVLSGKVFAAAVLGVAIVGHALAAPAPSGAGAPPSTPPQNPPPLPPAPPASTTREAQNIGRPLLYWGAGGAVIITGVILLSQDEDDGATTTTATTGTGN